MCENKIVGDCWREHETREEEAALLFLEFSASSVRSRSRWLRDSRVSCYCCRIVEWARAQDDGTPPLRASAGRRDGSGSASRLSLVCLLARCFGLGNRNRQTGWAGVARLDSDEFGLSLRRARAER